jgi:hypothetical protein
MLMMSSSLGGRSGLSRTGGVGARSRIARKISADVSPRNGSVPVAISYNTAPKENRSVRASSSFPAPRGFRGGPGDDLPGLAFLFQYPFCPLF